MDSNTAVTAILVAVVLALGCVVASSNWAEGQASVAAVQAGLQQCLVEGGKYGELAWQKSCEK